MVKSKFCWITSNWTSRPLPINSTSLLEDHLSIARPDSIEFESCSSRGHEIVSLISQFAYVILVDLIVVINLSFESHKTMPYWVRFEGLKFGAWFLFCSIHMIYDVLGLTNSRFMMCIERPTHSCVWFPFLEKMFLKFMMMLLFVTCARRRWCLNLRPRFQSVFRYTNALPYVCTRVCYHWLHERPCWPSDWPALKLNETVRIAPGAKANYSN